MKQIYRLFQKLHKDSSGQALLEFTMVLPLCLIFTAAIFNYGAVMSDVEKLNTSLRYGGTMGYHATRSYTTYCRDVVEYVEAYTADHVLNSNANSRGWWKEPEARVYRKSWLGLETSFLEVSIETNEIPHCTFCFENIMSQHPIKLKTTFPIIYGCV